MLGQAPLRELGSVDYNDIVSVSERGRQEPTSVARLPRVTASNLRGERRVSEARKSLEDRLRHLESDDIADIIADAEREAGPRAGVDIAAQAEGFARSLTFTVTIPGDHYSGLSCQQLMKIFISAHRDFTEDTSALRDHVAERVANGFGRGSEWDEARATRLAQDAIREAIVERYQDNSAYGASIAPISAGWREWKSKHGFDRRVGIMTSQWLSFVKHADVAVS